MENVTKKSSAIFEIVKALIIAVIFSLVMVLVAAFFIKLCNIKDSAIPVINQVIKGISILLGCLLGIKSKHNSWLKGIVIGILYIALAFVLFSLLDGTFVFGIGLLNDVALGSITGMVSGILAGFKKEKV